MTPVLTLEDVRREYRTGQAMTVALDGVSLTVQAGEFVAVLGPSGSGKSTMMHLIGCLDRPTSGSVRLAGHDIAALDDDQLTSLRSQAIGFVFQQFQLLPQTSALDDVAMPLLYQGVNASDARGRAKDVLSRLGMADRLDHDQTRLSGGQQQRVAIARAVVTSPALILADEPTGALDTRSGEQVMDILKEMHEEGRTIVLITHDHDVAAAASRLVHLRDGRIVDEGLVA